jgi:hypothetical protein
MHAGYHDFNPSDYVQPERFPDGAAMLAEFTLSERVEGLRVTLEVSPSSR